MTQVAGNRGHQPPYSLSSSSRQAGRAPSNKQSGQNAQPVRFGGGPVHNMMSNGWQGFVNLSLPTFEKITEVFIWGFLAQDVVAMWLPRIFALLTEGREKYDPKEDPKAKDLPFAKQLTKWVDGNLKGLNWENFKEGTKREFATGPGLLIVPAVLFIGASKLANSSVKMPFSAVKGIGKGLERKFEKDSLDKLPEVTPEVYQKAVQEYVNSIFVDPLLIQHKGDALKKWSEDWVKNLLLENSKAKKEETTRLSGVLKKIIRDFNREHRIMPYPAKGNGKEITNLIADKYPLHRSEATWVSYQPIKLTELLDEDLEKAAQRLRQLPINDVLRDLKGMEGLVKEVGEKAADSEPLSELARNTTQKLIKMKFGLAMTATVVTAAYLAKLAFWAQSHGTYQATRFLNEKNAQAHSAKAKASHPQSAGTHMPSQCGNSPLSNTPLAGSTYALQPAFSAAPQLAQPLPFALAAQAWSPNPFGLPQLGAPLKFGSTERGDV
jgi:hypothetical protein